jgi:hypothetical protein
MNIFPDICNVLHDGSIEGITGSVPGTLVVDVGIIYLRERIPDPGTLIRITLTDCTLFSYLDFPSSKTVTDLPAIVALDLEIKSAGMEGEVCEVYCADGVLKVIAASGSISLDSGRAVTLDELCGEAEGYWSDWTERNKREREERLKLRAQL